MLDRRNGCSTQKSLFETCAKTLLVTKNGAGNGQKPNKHGKLNLVCSESLSALICFRPTRGDLTPTYQGIWFDQEHRFIVGDINPLKLTGQAKAHLVRQFVIHQGMGKLDICSLLANQCSFCPSQSVHCLSIFFHLIDLYIENVLQ